MSDVKDLIERLRASGTANAPRNSKGIYMSICDEAAAALERLSAERDAAREALRHIAELPTREANFQRDRASVDVLIGGDAINIARAALKAEPVEP
jgi:hypothetical protein